MFHTLDELKQKNEIQKIAKERKKTMDNYVGGTNGLGEKNYGKRRSVDISAQYERTKHKVKVAMYKNGFILNDGKFRDKSIPENQKFMEEVEEGNIPQELVKQGYTELGILLENHRTEIYGLSTKSHNNIFNPVNFPFGYQHSNSTNFPYNYAYPYSGQMPYSYSTQTEQTPNFKSKMDMYRQANNEIRSKRDEDLLTKSSAKMVDVKVQGKDKEPLDTQQFVPFCGRGKTLSEIDITGLKIDKQAPNNFDKLSPCVSVRIRLFNGMIIEAFFNTTQTLRDVYYYVRNVSGSNNFTLVEGFPPRPLREYDYQIGSLGLHRSLLTQRIN